MVNHLENFYITRLRRRLYPTINRGKYREAEALNAKALMAEAPYARAL